jgi:class I fructose-bisphosphate aldolase
MLLGKQVRLNRLANPVSGRMLSVAMDHGIATSYTELPYGLEKVPQVLAQVTAGKPDSVVLNRGMAMHCLAPYAGRVSWMMQTNCFSPHMPNVDHQFSYVEDALALGADAIAMTITVGDDGQGREITMLGELVRAALPVGLPVVAHIYAKGNQVPPGQLFALPWVRYGARVGAEVGVDIVKVPYTGSADTFAEVVETCPVPVVASGGPRLNSVEELFAMVRGVVDAGARGATIGRNVWGDPCIAGAMAGLRAIMHGNARVEEAMALYRAEQQAEAAQLPEQASHGAGFYG